MENEKFILGLDVSTSTVGICLFRVDGKLVELNHVSPIVKDENISKQDLLLYKCNLVVNFLVENYPPENIVEIILETPLISSQQTDTAAMLNYFGGIVYATLRQFYKEKISYITVDEARRFGLPELVGGKSKSLFGVFNGRLERKIISDYKKMIVLSLVAQRYPAIVWLLNNNMAVDKKNFDRADSIVVVLGEKQRNSIWPSNPKDIEQTIEFINRNITYENFCKTLTGIKEEKDKEKYNYLKNTFEIEKFLNVAL
jgi:hypothetical protein